MITDYWYSTGTASAVFYPAAGNPYYWSKEETTTGSFSMSMNWNNGNGLNSGTITDNIFGGTITFGKNDSPEFQYAKDTVFPKNWVKNAKFNNTLYWWHLYWEKANTIKSYYFTVKDLEAPGIDIVYEVLFPNPGGNTSQAAGRTRVSDDFFHRTFENGDQTASFTWNGEAINTVMNVIGQIKLFENENWPPKSGGLKINKELKGWYDTDWGVDAATEFTAKVKNSDGNYLTFTVGGTASNSYTYYGTVSGKELGSTVTFSGNSPAVIEGIPEGQVCTVEEILNTGVDFVNVTYSNNAALIEDDKTTEVTVTNEYKHGVGKLKITKLLDGFPSDWDIDDSTVFYARIYDVDYDNYLMFKTTPEADGSYWCVGNNVIGLTENYDGATMIEIPYSAAKGIELSNLWTWGKYEVREVRKVNGEWVEVREITSLDMDCTLCTEEHSGNPDISGITTIHSAECEACTVCGQWSKDNNWTWGVVYSENNGMRELRFGETINVTITNRYKYKVNSISVYKEIEGVYDKWEADNDTEFKVKVFDIGDNNYLMFDPVPNADGSYECIGHLDCGNVNCANTSVVYNGVTVHYRSYAFNGFIIEIPFSVNSPALITNIKMDSPYRIEEVTNSSNGFTITYALNNVAQVISDGVVFRTEDADKDDNINIKVTNSYEEYGVTYDLNWREGETTITAPVDDNKYVNGEAVEVQPFSNNSDWVFLGWDENPDADTPAYTAGNEDDYKLIINGGDVTLYAIWAQVQDIEEITKTAEKSEYIPGSTENTINYTITVKLPDDVRAYGSIRIEDVIPAELKECRLISAKVGNTIVQPLITTDSSGNVSFTIDGADLAGGKTVTFIVKFNIESTATDSIINTANVYVTPLNGEEPDLPNEETIETVVVPSVKDVSKTTTISNYVPGNSIEYTITFDLPNDIEQYNLIKIEDIYNSGLMSYSDGSISLTIGSTPVTILQNDIYFYNNAMSFSILNDDLVSGQTVTLILTFNISDSTTEFDTLRNTVKVYINDIETPSGTDEATVAPPEKYAVTYDANWPGTAGYGDVPEDNYAYSDGELVTVKSSDENKNLGKSGWAFMGWSRSRTATEEEYFAGDEITIHTALWITRLRLSFRAM